MEIKMDERKWNVYNTRMLLNLYNARQEDFQNPKKKIKDVWRQMVVELKSKGMKGIDAIQLDRKFRNLKKTYYSIRNKYVGKGPQFHPNWPFYDMMSMILKEDPIPSSHTVTGNAFSALETILGDGDPQDNTVSDIENENVYMDNRDEAVNPRQVGLNRKRKSEDSNQKGMRKIRKSCKEPVELPSETEQITAPNAAEIETFDLTESNDEISINSKEEALMHLRAIQEYAMIQDNFRAIGLLMQAEHAIQYPPKTNDFEEEQ
ncbi:uncharacterized protein LOC108104629 [Drosophila eugracilis]|uniref:uncharacterized protein LOC108104629 n=1 Tax=Drosophila eugracilis TaxID=29029 RepID=UPI0007E73BCA|nr:uncharacterized protein LOC108104629 [Drosophila eugracilis]